MIVNNKTCSNIGHYFRDLLAFMSEKYFPNLISAGHDNIGRFKHIYKYIRH